MIPGGFPLAICAALSAIGWGLALKRILRIQANLGDCGVLGLMAFAALGCLIHFFAALSVVVQDAVLLLGVAMLVLWLRDAGRMGRGSPWALVAAASAFFHVQAVSSYDNGLYYLQTFRWANEHPLTLGLANLHGRLGFNSLLFAVAPLDDRLMVGWVSNLLLLLFVLLSCWVRMEQLPRKSAEFLSLCVAIWVLVWLPGVLGWLGVFNCDGFAAILVVYWFTVALSARPQLFSNVALLVLVSAFAICIKLSTVPLLIFGIAVLYAYRRQEKALPLRALAAAGMLLLLWTVRGVLTSGCLVYPVPQLCLPVPWAVSHFQVAKELASIRSWARIPGRNDYFAVLASGWGWVGPWWQRTLQPDCVRLLLAGVGLGAMAVAAGVRVSRQMTAALAGIALAVAYWFMTAPDVRFASGFLAMAGILGIGIALSWRFVAADVARRLTTEAIVAAMVAGVFGLWRAGNTWAPENPPVFELRAVPGSPDIWRTVNTDQCWDHPLPCTPDFRPDDIKRIRWR